MIRVKTSQAGTAKNIASVLKMPGAPGRERSRMSTRSDADDQKAPCSATPESGGRCSGRRMAFSARAKRLGILRASVTQARRVTFGRKKASLGDVVRFV